MMGEGPGGGASSSFSLKHLLRKTATTAVLVVVPKFGYAVHWISAEFDPESGYISSQEADEEAAHLRPNVVNMFKVEILCDEEVTADAERH